MIALDAIERAVLPLRDAGESKGAAELLVAHVDLSALIEATDRLATAAERRDTSIGCPINLIKARAELADAAANARNAIASLKWGEA